MIQVLTKLAARFPNSALFKLISNKPMFDVMVNEWLEALEDHSPRSIEYGLDMVNKAGSDFAPALPAFLNLCRPVHIYDRCDHLPAHQKPAHLLTADERPALPMPGKRFSLAEHRLRHNIEERERLKHLDDNLDEKREKFLRDLNNCIER